MDTKLNHFMLNLPRAAVLAKRWQSAAHFSTDNVARRVGLSGVINDQIPTPRPGALTADLPLPLAVRARPATGTSIKKQLLATFVITTCHADLKPGDKFELLLETFVITTCYFGFEARCTSK